MCLRERASQHSDTNCKVGGEARIIKIFLKKKSHKKTRLSLNTI
ncbi:hypothetical protein HBZC1_17810 [Helicobacter bizzozeronii CIII-1]|uniref:Uncharacterized protein n=1 Tax=Helicobacter bizzozeronii (strain CIII-1) TaxID=1002804 RepID=F8KQG9_HELBC|nr:hypothetical protein HBZC1_17810 [Helicobacter bizzozeronii CIII-1]